MRFKLYILLIITSFSIVACENAKNAEAVVEKFYSYRLAQDNEKVRFLLSDEFIAATQPQEFVNYLNFLDTTKGKIKSYTIEDIKIETKNEITTAVFSLRVRYETDVSLDTLILIQHNQDTFKILLLKQKF